MAQQHPLRTAPHRWIDDGAYTAGDGTAWRWFIEALPDLAAPLLLQTVQGTIDGTVQSEVANASRVTACAAIERLIADRAAKAARKVNRAGSSG